MLLTINASKLTGGCSDSMKELLREKLSFLDNFIKEDEHVKIVFDKNKKKLKAKTSVLLKDNHHVRIETIAEKYEDLINEIKDDLFDVIKRHNHSKKEKKVRSSRREKEKIKDRKNFTVNKHKKITLSKMREDETIE